MKLDTLEPDFKAIVEDILEKVSVATGLTWIVVSARRTMREQELLYAKGRTTPGPIVTKATAGSSAHNFGLGCDCAPIKEGSKDVWWNAPRGYWEVYGGFAKDAGMKWGGDFSTILDLPHIEHPRWKEQRELWRAGKVIVK